MRSLVWLGWFLSTDCDLIFRKEPEMSKEDAEREIAKVIEEYKVLSVDEILIKLKGDYCIGNEDVYKLAKLFSRVPDIELLSQEEIGEYVKVWWEIFGDEISDVLTRWEKDKPDIDRHPRFCTTEDLEQALDQFGEIWKNVKNLVGTVDIAIEKAKQFEAPEAKLFTNPKVRKLITVCYFLKNEHNIFFLSGGIAGRIMGTSQSVGSERLRMFVRKGVLKIIKESKGRKAKYYKYNHVGKGKKDE